MKVTLTKIYRTTKNKEGQPLIGKNGKGYERLGIKTQEHGDQWLSGFGGSWNQYWQEGEQVDINVVEVQGKDKVFLNFEKIDETKLTQDKLTELENRIIILENKILNSDDVNPEDIPF